MNCSDCKYKHFESGNGNPNRYYCIHPVAAVSVNAGARLICKTKRHSEKITIKKSPRWCPLKREV